MERFGFRNFGVLSFLQQIDKPRFLIPLLRPYSAYFRRRGLYVEHLRNSDECDRQLLAVFGEMDSSMPGALLGALTLLDDLADEAGHDRILAEVERNEIPLRGILGEDLSPGEFAIAVFVRYPQVVRDAHAHTTQAKLRLYEEYQAVRDQPIALAEAQAKLTALEELLGYWFESKNRTPACKIIVAEQGADLWFEIVHGRPYRMIGTINAQLEHARVGYRPQQHDSVIFERHGCVLKVSAQTLGERELYRQAFGMAFFENENHFPLGDLYNLEPLRRGGATLVMVAGIEAARLTELRMRLDDEQGKVQVSQGRDLLVPGGPFETAPFARGKIVGASFLITYESGGPPRRLEIRPPNVALYDRARDREATNAFLHANELLSGRPR